MMSTARDSALHSTGDVKMPDTIDSDVLMPLEGGLEAIGSSARAIRTIIARHCEETKVVQYILFTNVPPSIAAQDFTKSGTQMYDDATRRLVVKLVAGPHESAVGGIKAAINESLVLMGKLTSVYSSESKRVKGSFCRKEPDGSWAPWPPAPERDEKWPAVVLEVGASETAKKLKADATWWLCDSRGQVNLVILISVNDTLPEVTFETHFATPAPLNLRNNRIRYQCAIRQSIKVSRGKAQPDGTITTSPNENPLVIGFNEMFCRAPVPPEHDLQITTASLRHIATLIWHEQGM